MLDDYSSTPTCGAEGTLALPAISGTTVVWAACRACRGVGGLPASVNVRIYA